MPKTIVLAAAVFLAGCSSLPTAAPVAAKAGATTTPAKGTPTPGTTDPRSFSDFPAAQAPGSGSSGAVATAPASRSGTGKQPATALNLPSNDPTSPRYAGMSHANPARLPFDSRYEQLPGYAQVKSLRSPLPATPIKTATAKELWGANCLPCHGDAGKGNGPAAPVLADAMRDLSNPYAYKYGASDIAIYRSVAYGLPGSVMGTFLGPLKDDQIWALVGYMKALQKPPALVSR